MINAIESMTDSQLENEFTFPWGVKTTVKELHIILAAHPLAVRNER